MHSGGLAPGGGLVIYEQEPRGGEANGRKVAQSGISGILTATQ